MPCFFFVDIANLGMANIALPTIQRALGYDEGSVQWVLTAYSLTVSSIPKFCLFIETLLTCVI